MVFGLAPSPGDRQHTESLARVGVGLLDPGVPVFRRQGAAGEVVGSWLRGRPATALIREVMTAHHDVVIRPHARDLADQPRRYGAVDMELL